MGFNWTTDALLTSIKRRAQLAANAENLSDADILALADDETQSYLMPLLIGVNEEFAVTVTDITINVNQSEYDIPVRAIGRELRDVQYLTTQGAGNAYIQLPRLEPENSPALLTGGIVAGYYFQGDKVVLTPSPVYSSTLRLKWFYRPNKLVPVSECATISSINGARTTITTTSTIPSTFAPGVSLDVVNSRPGFATKVEDATATSGTTGTTIVLTSALPSSVVAGDYVCLAQEACVVQIPPDLYSLLAERVAFKCLEAVGDPKAEVQKKVADEMEEKIYRLISPRSKGGARRIVSKYGPGQANWWYQYGWRGWR